jgi:hypothetical protein
VAINRVILDAATDIILGYRQERHMKSIRLMTLLVLAFATADGVAATLATTRMKAARELQSTFDQSLIKGFELKFVVRGALCDVLHIEGYTNLTEGMIHGLANGTLIYGRVLPGGVNPFAFGRGFRQIIYTNTDDPTYESFGAPKLTRKRVKQMRRCTDAIAAKVVDKQPPAVVPSPPPFVALSWANAQVGTKLYDGAYRHDATIVRIARNEGLIYVRYVRSGSTEPKLLNAVAQFWYVRK